MEVHTSKFGSSQYVRILSLSLPFYCRGISTVQIFHLYACSLTSLLSQFCKFSNMSKLPFLSTSFKNSVYKGGGMHGRGHAWSGGACVAGGACMAGGCAWLGGVHGREHAWQGVCMEGGHAWQGTCVGGGGACVAGEMAIAAGGTHPTGMHSCSLE